MKEAREAFQLAASEKQSALWSRIEVHLEDRLEDLRQQNDAVGNDETQTAHLRGRIAELKRLLELGKTRPEVVVPSV